MANLPPLILPGFPRPVPRWLAERHIPDLDRFAALLPELRILEAIDPEDGKNHAPQFWHWRQQGKLDAILEAQRQIVAISREIARLAEIEAEHAAETARRFAEITKDAPPDADAADYFPLLWKTHN